jgi:hypothetical protein
LCFNRNIQRWHQKGYGIHVSINISVTVHKITSFQLNQNKSVKQNQTAIIHANSKTNRENFCSKEVGYIVKEVWRQERSRLQTSGTWRPVVSSVPNYMVSHPRGV